MKIFKSLFLIALLATSISLHAENDKPEPRFTVKSEIENNNDMVYQLTNLQQVTTTVQITSIDGKTTFYKTNIRKHNGFSEKINMGELSDGRYIFQVEQGAFTKKQIILIRDSKASVSGITD